MPLSRATIRAIPQAGDRIRATRAREGMPIDQAARHCGVSIGMLSTLESGKRVNLEHALGVMDGLGLTTVVVPKVHAPWLEQAAAHAAKIGQETACLAGRVEGGDQDERQGSEGLLDWGAETLSASTYDHCDFLRTELPDQ